MSFDEEMKSMVISVRGTLSLSDCLTDTICRPIPFSMKSALHLEPKKSGAGSPENNMIEGKVHMVRVREKKGVIGNPKCPFIWS